jgi:hypothetical protein
VVKYVGAVDVRIVVAAVLAAAAVPCSSYNTSQNFAPIWLPHGLLKK